MCNCASGTTSAAPYLAGNATGVAGGGAVQVAGAAPIDVTQVTQSGPIGQVSQVGQFSGGGPAGSSRASAIPLVTDGRVSLNLGLGQASFRQMQVAPGTYNIPAPGIQGGIGVEVLQIRDYVVGGHATQVLVPVQGQVQVGADANRFLVRVVGASPGNAARNIGIGTVNAHVSSTAVQPLPMMTWVNASDAKARGASQGAVESVLERFGVGSTGTAGSATRANGRGIERQYFSAAYEAANKGDVNEVARRILQQERTLGSSRAGSELWVQVSDEQDHTPQQVAATVQWVSQLKRILAANGSQAKLFVAAQAKPENLGYAAVVDGWATTQSSAGRSRNDSVNMIRQAGARYGKQIELMEYPGNAYFDGEATSGAAVSVASAALDGAKAWFLFAANNNGNLERGQGIEGRGDIGGLVAVHGGSVYPTLALAEAEYGANLGGAAQAVGSASLNGSGAQSVISSSRQLDAYKHGSVPNLLQLELELARYFR